MSSVRRRKPDIQPSVIPPALQAAILKEDRWRPVLDNLHISREVLTDYFHFLNDAVVVRGGKSGVPYMTTTGIWGPIMPGTTVQLDQVEEPHGIKVIDPPPSPKPPTLIEQLKTLQAAAPTPAPEHAATVSGYWTGVDRGGAIRGLGGSANVFGGTGQLIVSDPVITFPVLSPADPKYGPTLAYYGGKLLEPGERFDMGFQEPLFGMEYDGVLPNYISDYAMEPYGGGGLFVEHHPFPHIWQPIQTVDGKVRCVSKITLGRRIDNGDPTDPQFHFTTFRVPSTDNRALAILPGTIHNDSYTNGPQIVYLSYAVADTVAIRESKPFEALHLEDVEPPLPGGTDAAGLTDPAPGSDP